MYKILMLSAAALLCASCIHVNSNFKGGKNALKGAGPIITKNFDFQDFHSVCVYGNADVVFTQADTWEVTLTTQENVLDKLDYKVEDGVLVIQAQDRMTIRAEEYDLTIKAPVLRRVEVNGAADFDIPSGFRSEEDLTVEVNGAGDLSFRGIACRNLKIQANGAADIDAKEVDVQSVNVLINGAGDVSLTGKAGEADLSVNGAGDIDARKLAVAGEVKKHTSGIAKIQL